MQNRNFLLPTEGQIYIKGIIDRCNNLIYHDIWNGIHVTRLKKWLSNFESDEELYFATCILDFLIYRSKDQTIAMMKQLFQRVLPDLHRLDPMPINKNYDFEIELNVERFPIDPGIRLVAVLKKTDPPSKSAPAIARLMKRSLKVNEDLIIRSDEIESNLCKGVRVFLFIDDFLGTGTQFKEFIESENIEKYFSDAYFTYIPTAAHFMGIKKLKGTFSDLRVTAVEILDDSHNLFHEDCLCFQDGINDVEAAKIFYHELLKARNINLEGPDRRGFGHFALAYAFSHAVPDNCLPLLWWPSDNWYPLFDR